ncbi:MAG: aminoglycoside phosphotransferase family protein [Lachnospiraceae bacterium]|nr:aminoglycoside phosphotransferase family protein [Lachnospiraceae bacterium]
MTKQPIQIAEQFRTDGSVTACTPHAGGFINHSFLAETDSGKRYLLQQVSSAVFPDVPGLMDNMLRVTKHLSGKEQDSRKVLRVVPAQDGASFVRDEDGAYWRMLVFIENSVCLPMLENTKDFYEAAVAIGRFQHLLGDFPAETLCEVIPGFHHTPGRFAQFHRVIEEDPAGRLAEVQEDVDFLLSLEGDGAALQSLLDAGELPLRVAHNDAKISNVLLDSNTHEALCVIDLDTVMPGLTAFDYGEAIRSGACGAKEDEPDLSKVTLNMELVNSFTEGFLQSCGSLTKKEIETLPLGAKLMTLENGIRILGDYIAGDVYYVSHYPKQNLYRARTQIKLLKEFEAHWDEMCDAVSAYL